MNVEDVPSVFPDVNADLLQMVWPKGTLDLWGSLAWAEGDSSFHPIVLLNNRNVNADFSYVPAFFGCKAAFETVRRCELPFS